MSEHTGGIQTKEKIKNPQHVAFYAKLNTRRKSYDLEENDNLTQGKLHKEKKAHWRRKENSNRKTLN